MARKQKLEEPIDSNRPLTSAGRLDQRLAGLALALRGVVTETQKMFIYPACQLDNDALDELAVALVEFAEDIHAGIGLWQALENYQSEFFGTPLPLFLDVGEPLSGRFDPRRVRHFLYILWRQLKSDLILAPDHRDLTELAETLSEFLAAAFRQQPKDSGVARFLHTPNRRGWDVKRKLVWAGQHSYLFRHQCARYLEEQRTGTTDIDAIDDFICQHCTDWCGLGVIDLLAAAVDLPEPDRATLRTWYERHNAQRCHDREAWRGRGDDAGDQCRQRPALLHPTRNGEMSFRCRANRYRQPRSVAGRVVLVRRSANVAQGGRGCACRSEKGIRREAQRNFLSLLRGSCAESA